MSDERMRILGMLQEGKITVDEAAKLIASVEKSAPNPDPPRPTASTQTRLVAENDPDAEEQETAGFTYQGAIFEGASFMGANLIGALVGGLLQSITFVIGVKALLLIVMALYLAALLTKPRAVSEPSPATSSS